LKISKKIKSPISEELKSFERQFFNSVSSKITLLDLVLKYILKRKGKQIRPILVILFSKMFAKGKIPSKTYRAANLVELIHTASLVHDDIVDDSNIRRRFLTINALWKNKISVLVGDFFLSKALLLSTKNKDYDLLDEISTAVKEISEGELFQIQKSRSLKITEEEYILLISKKTASLFSCCCSLGLISSGNKKSKSVEDFGLFLGIIFQIKDDLFDYSQRRIGKPTKYELKNQKITLPLIYSIKKDINSEKRLIKSILKRKKLTVKGKNKVYQFIKDNDGFDYAKNVMLNYKNKALKILESFPDNESKQSLRILLDYIIDRKY